MAQAKKTTQAKKAAPRKAPAKRAAKVTTPNPERDTAYGFTVGDKVHFADVDPREDRTFTIVQTTGNALIGESDGQRYTLAPAKIAKVD